MKRRFGLLSLAIGLLLPAAALACLWDSETLKQERARFPTALELITGKFLRHSKEFYEWRIKDRQKKLQSDPKNVGYYDDIAVAYEKIGQHDKAIETILKKEEIEPGLYETYSNLGTFHILAGDFEKGLPYIDKALAINPDAHFGREKYQKWLVEYAMTRMEDGKLTFPLRRKPNHFSQPDSVPATFYDYLYVKGGGSVDVQAAVTGVLGMMRFANHENPLLLEALADLLLLGHTDKHQTDAKQLAARAMLKASYVVEDSETKAAYRRLAEDALAMQTKGRYSSSQMPLSDLESGFRNELADAERWYAALQEREESWIRTGQNVEAEFDRLYSVEPVSLMPPERIRRYSAFYVGASVIVISLGLMTIVVWRCRRRTGPSGAGVDT